MIAPQVYAAAGIGWYLRVEQVGDAVELHLLRLADGLCRSAAVAGPGEVLAMAEPFPFAVEVASLLHRGRRG